MRKACVVLPTYNERENIGKMIGAIHESVKQSPGWEVSIVVVDDNSPDGTADVVRKKQKQYERVHLVTGERFGLGGGLYSGVSVCFGEFGAGLYF